MLFNAMEKMEATNQLNFITTVYLITKDIYLSHRLII